MKTECQAFTEGEVAKDGSVALGFVDESGNPIKVRLSINQVGALAMTLPELIATALRNRHGNQKMRFAYPLASWVVEQSASTTQRIVTLETKDGFRVRFSILEAQQSLLSEALIQPLEARVLPN